MYISNRHLLKNFDHGNPVRDSEKVIRRQRTVAVAIGMGATMTALITTLGLFAG